MSFGKALIAVFFYVGFCVGFGYVGGRIWGDAGSFRAELVETLVIIGFLELLLFGIGIERRPYQSPAYVYAQILLTVGLSIGLCLSSHPGVALGFFLVCNFFTIVRLCWFGFKPGTISSN